MTPLPDQDLLLMAPSAYQEHLGKIMTDKYTHLSRGMDKVINDANMEIQGLQTKVMSRSGDIFCFVCWD